MSWEQFWENISNIGDLSLVTIITAALLYYFGRLIVGVKVEKYEKTDCYIQGLFFSLIYIALPFVFVLLLTQYANLYLPLWFSLLFQIIIFVCLWLSTFAHEYLRRHGCLPRFKKSLQEKIERLRTFAFVRDKAETSKKDLTEVCLLIYYKIPIKVFGDKSVLLLFSFIILWSAYSCISPEIAFKPFTIFLSILTFLNLTFLALTYGYAIARYPYAKIRLENGIEITGKVLKFGEFICLLKEDEEKKLFINKDKIISIEENLFIEKSF